MTAQTPMGATPVDGGATFDDPTNLFQLNNNIVPTA